MGKDELMKKSITKNDLIRIEGDKVYVDKLLAEIMEARKEVLKELAKR
jgi:hypothetical protein